jgi:hypothetical protein
VAHPGIPGSTFGSVIAVVLVALVCIISGGGFKRWAALADAAAFTCRELSTKHIDQAIIGIILANDVCKCRGKASGIQQMI